MLFTNYSVPSYDVDIMTCHIMNDFKDVGILNIVKTKKVI